MALVDSITSLGRGTARAHDPAAVDRLKENLTPAVTDALQGMVPGEADRAELSRVVRETVIRNSKSQGVTLTLLQERNLVTALLNEWLAGSSPASTPTLLTSQPSSSACLRTGLPATTS